ncbi:polysaccharide deacetylase family protein [Chitinophagaceae bacterium LB-8]|uniref:Polysaccharide deacetylase family protein n=1 Tax=Paraflavisolibacter caeni TaxID=2982496 RepID=A0A9X2Y1L1_9BACT|nr:polysaccharide deacetylase family protein [Paraflavisolibacter caeni]MCU7551643.1 polysaccharide deacetylase family protein [Paraflavisolibacter caeni]
MLLYCHTITPRIKYVVDFISQYFLHPFQVTANEQAYIASSGFKINYSHQRFTAEEIHIKPCPILSESEKRRFHIHTFQHKHYKAFFETDGDMRFDLFGAIFYLLSRYEEYLPHEKDVYGRFAHQSSVAYREEFLHLPLINIWLEDFRELCLQKFPELQFTPAQFQFLPTYDIDIAWSHKHKTFKQNFGGIMRAILQGKWSAARKHIRVLKGKIEDPFDAYEWMDELHERFNLHPIFFILVAAEKNKYDRNIDIHHQEFQKLVHSIATKNKVGLHPSWASSDHRGLLGREKMYLEKVTNQHIHASRQHYIRMSLPHTYQFLIDNGITHEYSMGYGSINGFRASVALPFYWYDLEREEKTNLIVHPFCFMDANAYYEQSLTAQEALQEMLQFYTAIKSVNGNMCTLWHNNFLGTADEFAGWRDAYENFIQIVSEGN